MKKLSYIMISIIILSFVFSGCAQTHADKTIRETVAYDIKINDNVKVNEINSTASGFTYKTDIETIAKRAPVIITGKIKNIVYTSMQGIPWTKVDVVVIESLKGDLNKDDIITIYKKGGYIPLKEKMIYFHNKEQDENISQEEINKTIVKETINNEKISAIGEESIYFLDLTAKDSQLPKGVYERLAFGYGELTAVINEDESSNNTGEITYKKKCKDDSSEKDSYTLEEIKSII